MTLQAPPLPRSLDSKLMSPVPTSLMDLRVGWSPMAGMPSCSAFLHQAKKFPNAPCSTFFDSRCRHIPMGMKVFVLCALMKFLCFVSSSVFFVSIETWLASGRVSCIYVQQLKHNALLNSIVCGCCDGGSISSYGNLHTTVLVFAGQTQSFS